MLRWREVTRLVYLKKMFMRSIWFTSVYLVYVNNIFSKLICNIHIMRYKLKMVTTIITVSNNSSNCNSLTDQPSNNDLKQHGFERFLIFP